MTKDEFHELCDKFRSSPLEKDGDEWKLRKTPY